MIRLSHLNISPEMEQCIDHCTDCHDVCIELIDHCLRQGGRYAEPDRVKLFEDCAEICQTALDFMVRESARYPLTCAVSAAICDEVARDCAMFQDDEIMQRCAEIARKCGRSLRSMVWHVDATA